jgi:putative heme-binding domain-containing protein
MDAPELAKLLGDPRPAVQDRAIHELSRQKEQAVAVLAKVSTDGSANAPERLNAVWALTRIEAPKARAAVRAALSDSDDTVRIAAAHSISAWRDSNAVAQLSELLGSSASPHVKRAMAEALGRVGGAGVASALLKEAAGEHDRVLEHSIIYALIETADRSTVAAALADNGNSGEKSHRMQRAALIALDQMDGGELTADMVIANLRSSSRPLRETSEWILTRRPQWSEELIPFFEKALNSADDEAARQAERMLDALGSQQALQSFIAEVAGDTEMPKRARLAVLRSMAQSGLKEMPAAWSALIERVSKDSDARLVEQAVRAARALPPPKEAAERLAKSLREIARRPDWPAQLRLDALAALPGGRKLDDDLFRFAIKHVTPHDPVSVRSSAVTVLSKARPTPEQLSAVAEALKRTGPLEAPKLLALFAKATNEALGLKLIESLRATPSLLALPAQTVRSCLTNFPAAIQKEANQLFAASDAPSQHARLEQLLAELPRGDVRRGQALFNSSATACSACHAIGYLGGNLGPDLTRIGQVRTERDLLESIAYPSASFVRSYEPVVVLTRSGDQFSGVLRKDAADEVVLGTGPDAETRIARADIAELRPGSLSVMPEGMDHQLSRQELSDLLTFLKATRW